MWHPSLVWQVVLGSWLNDVKSISIIINSILHMYLKLKSSPIFSRYLCEHKKLAHLPSLVPRRWMEHPLWVLSREASALKRSSWMNAMEPPALHVFFFVVQRVYGAEICVTEVLYVFLMMSYDLRCLASSKRTICLFVKEVFRQKNMVGLCEDAINLCRSYLCVYKLS